MKSVLKEISYHSAFKNSLDPDFISTKKRLGDLGFVSGVELEVVREIWFGDVVVVRIFQTLIALNSKEFACLKF